MAQGTKSYDPVGIVVDRIDACKRRRLDDLLNLYDAEAIVDCCEGGTFRGRSEIERYWRPRPDRAPATAFEISAITTQPAGVMLDYREYDGVPVRAHFRFTDAGKISLTACEPIKAAA